MKFNFEIPKPLKNIAKIGLMATIGFTTLNQGALAQDGKELKHKHEYTLDEVKDFNKFVNMMKSENSYSDYKKGLEAGIQCLSEDDFYKMQQKKFMGYFGKYKEAVDWNHKNINSQEYKNRLTHELHGDSVAAQKMIHERLSNLEGQNDFRAVDEKLPHGLYQAFYNSENKKILVGNDLDPHAESTVIPHEISHKITDDTRLMTDYAKDLFKKAFTDLHMTDHEGFFEFLRDYFKNPTELYARKEALEQEMEKLGIKKYEDVFSESHYKKLLELNKEGKLSTGSSELLRMIKPEYFYSIMNTLAQSDSSTVGRDTA